MAPAIAATARARFLAELYAGPGACCEVFDPWNAACPDDVDAHGVAGRRARLEHFFDGAPAEWLLVGEAPGYQGCRVSGLAFTSEALLVEGSIPRVGPPAARLTTRWRPWSEPSARIVWKTLYRLGLAERMWLWNTYPWHPNVAGEPYSNRAPRAIEIARGVEILAHLLAMAPASDWSP